MKTNSVTFRGAFDDDPILDGREFIEADLGGGVTVRAYVEVDPTDDPSEWADAATLAAFNRGELRSADLTLRVYIAGVCIDDDAACLGGVWVAGRDGDGDYLTERANELLAENRREIAATVRDFAEDAADAAAAMGRHDDA